MPRGWGQRVRTRQGQKAERGRGRGFPLTSLIGDIMVIIIYNLFLNPRQESVFAACTIQAGVK